MPPNIPPPAPKFGKVAKRNTYNAFNKGVGGEGGTMNGELFSHILLGWALRCVVCSFQPLGTSLGVFLSFGKGLTGMKLLV